ncbi:MAG: glycosyltransferase family 2 protein [Ginsengibacter sp.]
MEGISPLVSVLMTAYNREQYISEAIESVLASTYTNFELIIVDDCSKDNTVKIASSYAQKDKRIQVYVNDKNLDQFPNRNKAAEYAKGKYIKYLDSDDKIYGWGLAYCVEMMEKYPDAGMGLLKLQKEMKKEYLNSKDAITINYFDKPILNIGPSGTILRKSAFEEVGYYKADYGVPSDMYFNLKMASSFPIVLLDKEFFYYRIHDGQELQNTYSYVCYNYKYLNDALRIDGFPLTAEQKKVILKKARRSFVRIFLMYIKESGKILKAVKAIKISGIGFIGFLRGVF